MLIQFRAENFLSIKGSVVLSLLASKDKEHPKHLIVNGSKRYLKSAGIYGANASGKSNVLHAFWFMVNYVLTSHNQQLHKAIERSPFKFDRETPVRPSSFEVIFTANGIRYAYGFSVTDKVVIEEYLYYYPNGRQAIIFERQNTNDFRFTVDVDEQSMLKNRTSPNKLYLSVASNWSYSKVIPVLEWFASCRIITKHSAADAYELEAEQLKDDGYRHMIASMLRGADFGICCFAFVFCLFPSSAFATGGNGNIDGGGGSMGHGTSSNFWNSGNDGVRITVVDASSGTAVSSPLDFSNRTQKTSLLHFGKVNKLQYLGGAGLSLQSGVAYSCIRPAQSMPTIVSSKGQSNIEAIKRYFCSEYACMMVAQAAGVDYERMIAGEYKLLIEPIAYFTHNGQYYCMTATEAGLYDQMSGGNLRKTMTSLTHKNLPLSMFLEFSDLGISAWTGSTTGKQNNSDIISTLGVGIVWFDEAPPEGEIQAPDVEYRVDTDVITAVTLRTDQDLTPDNPASVTFHILGTTYRVNDIVIPAGDSQVVWVKWHTPSTPQTVTITVSVSGAYTAQDTFVAKIVDLNEHIPPDPVATDTNPGYSVPPLPNETQKLTANWGVWSCYWVPVWVWCDHGEDGGHWVDEGYWEYEYTGYSASISGEMSLMPDDIVPTASGKTMKSGYGVKTEVRATLSTDAPTSHITYPQTAFSVFPEFQYQTYLRLLQRSGGQSAKFIFKPNEFSTYDRTVHFTPLWFPDATDYTIYTQVWDTWTPDGMLSINLNDYVSIQGSLYDDWYTNRE